MPWASIGRCPHETRWRKEPGARICGRPPRCGGWQRGCLEACRVESRGMEGARGGNPSMSIWSGPVARPPAAGARYVIHTR